jgi:hypothetical protein
MAEIPGLKDVKMVNTGGALLTVAIGPIWTKTASAKETEMSATLSTTTISRPLVLVALIVVLLLAATLGLWAYYGTAVFFEMLRNGWAACF